MQPQDPQPEQPHRRAAWPPAADAPAPAPSAEPWPAAQPLPPAAPVESPPPQPETAAPWQAVLPPDGTVPPDGAEPAGEEGTTPPKPRRIPWKRLALAGVVLVALGVFTLGAAMGWTLGSRSAEPIADTHPEVIAAPTDAGGGVPVLPDVRGLLLVDAQQAVVDAGLPLDVVQTADAPSALAAGTVLRQDPVGGSTKVSKVTLYVSVPGAVPDLVGKTADEARVALLQLGAQFQQKLVYQPGAAEGSVLALDPAPGSPLAATITVTVAGPASSIFLSDLRPVEGGCSQDKTSINGKDFPNSLLCSVGSYENTTSYLLDRVTTSLDMTVGIADDSDTDVQAHVTVLADGRPVAAADVGYGQSKDISVPTTGVLRLEITYTASGEGSGRLALGDARVTGSPEGIASLDHQ